MVHVCEEAIRRPNHRRTHRSSDTGSMGQRYSCKFREKTGRCVIVHESIKQVDLKLKCLLVFKKGVFGTLNLILRVTGWDTPFPHTTEWDYIPSVERIVEAIRKTQE